MALQGAGSAGTGRVVLVMDEITPKLETWDSRHVATFLVGVQKRVGEVGAEASRGAYSGNSWPFSETGNLQRSISYALFRPRTGTGVVVGPMASKSRGLKGYHRYIVEGGTKPHRIRFHAEKAAGVPKGEGSILHPGARPHPWMTRAKPRIEENMRAEFSKAVGEELA